MKFHPFLATLLCLPTFAGAAPAPAANDCFYRFANEATFDSAACRAARAEAAAEHDRRLDDYRQRMATYKERLNLRIARFLRAHNLSGQDVISRADFPGLVRLRLTHYECEFSQKDISCTLSGPGPRRQTARAE